MAKNMAGSLLGPFGDMILISVHKQTWVRSGLFPHFIDGNMQLREVMNFPKSQSWEVGEPCVNSGDLTPSPYALPSITWLQVNSHTVCLTVPRIHLFLDSSLLGHTRKSASQCVGGLHSKWYDPLGSSRVIHLASNKLFLFKIIQM